MRLFEFTGSVWWNTTWHKEIKKSWNDRKYWVGGKRSTKKFANGDTGRTFTIDLGPLTINLTIKLILRSNDG